MPLSPRESFKTGFLARCAEEGLGAEGVMERIKVAHALCRSTEESVLLEKSADIAGGVGNIIGEGIEGIGNIAGKAFELVKASPWLTIGGAGVLGAGGGYGYGDVAANATNATQAASFDVEAVSSYARASATWLL